jgi:GH25 family lysozyme M1 (1,4-beta-N-acetylmuramidase)
MMSFILVFIALFSATLAYNGVDLSVATTVADWQCLVSDYNVTYAIIRTYRSVGEVDTNSPNTIHYAATAGIKDIGVYMFPCMPTSPYSISNEITCATPEQQVIDAVSFLQTNGIVVKRMVDDVHSQSNITVVNRVWLDIEDQSPAKYYDSDVTKNQEFVAAIVAQLEKMKIPVGIYVSKTNWQNIMGNIEGYGNYPLWYPRYDNDPSMDFFVPFADFTEVKIKQTAGNSKWCSLSQVDTDYREVESI